jgi:hypothetical protein
VKSCHMMLEIRHWFITSCKELMGNFLFPFFSLSLSCWLISGSEILIPSFGEIRIII